MDNQEHESSYGIRCTYESIPSSQELLEQIDIPLAIHCNPLKRDDIPNIDSQMITCKCGAFFNQYSQINYNTNSFYCIFCKQFTKLPSSTINLFQNGDAPQEITFPVYEYNSENQNQFRSNCYVFVIDTCCSPNNLISLKKELANLMETIDFSKYKICIITFNRIISLYKKTNGNMIHNIIIDSTMTAQQKQRVLGIKLENDKIVNNQNIEYMYFIDNQEELVDIIDSLEVEYWNSPKNERSQRATGKALELAIDVLTFSCVPSSRIVLFTSGPCTIGEGSVASIKMEEFIRKQIDLEENKEINDRCQKSTKFYDSLGKRMTQINSCLDVFGYSLDQFGLYEMRNIIKQCGGLVVINEEFVQDHFKQNLNRIFKPNSNGTMEIHQGCSIQVYITEQLKFCGAIGNLQATKSSIKNQGENKIGECNTDAWYIGGIDTQSTFLFFFELSNKNKNNAEPSGTQAYIQFVLRYHHSDGHFRTRIITVQKTFLNDKYPANFINQIDQFNIISTYAKIAAYRSMEQDSFFVRRYLDKKLISILKQFVQGQLVPEQLNLLPQYFYYLRKSQFVSKMASSLDEMIYYRQHILWQNPDNVLIMIQPQIIQYSLQSEEPQPVMPDIDCLKKDVVLLADTYFFIVIWQGDSIRSWIEQEYHLQDEYAYFNEFLQNPEEDYKLIIEDRLIVPEKMHAWSGSPDERLLKSKLNPEVKDSVKDHDAITSGNFVTDDASLSVFMTKLLTLVNQKDPQQILI